MEVLRGYSIQRYYSKQKAGMEEQSRILCSNNLFVKNKFRQKLIQRLIRVVRNIIENSTINDVATYMSAVNLIRELSNGWSDIYEYLTTNTVNARHAESQVKEEIEKAKIIIAYPDAKQVIHVAEDTHFCKGRIDFLLYCTDYDIENPDLTTFDKDKLEKVLNVIQSHFESNDEYELFVRSFLTIKKND